MLWIPDILVEKKTKKIRTLNYVRQTNTETKEKQRGKKGKIIIIKYYLIELAGLCFR